MKINIHQTRNRLGFLANLIFISLMLVAIDSKASASTNAISVTAPVFLYIGIAISAILLFIPYTGMREGEKHLTSVYFLRASDKQLLASYQIHPYKEKLKDQGLVAAFLASVLALIEQTGSDFPISSLSKKGVHVAFVKSEKAICAGFYKHLGKNGPRMEYLQGILKRFENFH